MCKTRLFLKVATRLLFGPIFVFGGIGCGDTSTTPPAPPPTPQATFAYVANLKSGSISGYAMDTSTGSLTPLTGFPLPSGTNPRYVIHDPQNRFVITADIAAARVHVFRINASTGMLTEVAPSPYIVGQEPVSLIIDPTGNFLYVADQDLNSVAAYALNSTGVLTKIPGSPFPTGGSSGFGCCVVMDPIGKFLFVEDQTQVYSFAVDSVSGVLTLTSSVAGPKQGTGLTVDPSGKFLYAVGAGTNSIESFTIDAVTGAITPSASSPLLLQDGSYTLSIAPAGDFAYTVEAAQTLVAYRLQNGVFTSINSYPGALGTVQLAIDASGSFLYAPQTGNADNVSGFTINSSGTLTPLPGSPTPSGQWPFSLTITKP